MKQETKELLEWIEKQINLAGTIITNVSQPYWQEDCKKALIFLNSLPEIESKLCCGGYIQDKNGTPCCDGDKVKFKFSAKDFEEHWKDRYAPIENGELKYFVEDKRFVILFGEDINGFDWIDWNGAYDGCEWFEKVEG